MQLSRLVYYSHNAMPWHGTALAAAVTSMLHSAIRNNARRDVTGGLVFNRGHFLQVLEGDRAVVAQAFEVIATDPRHRHVVLVGVKPITARQFGAWPMGYAGNGEGFDVLCARLCMGEIFDPSLMTGDQLAAFVLELVSNEQQAMPSQRPSAATRVSGEAECVAV